MKLMMIIKGISPAPGGAERVAATLLKGFVERDINVTLVSLDKPASTSFFGLPPNVNWIQLGIGDVTRKMGFVNFFKAVWALRRVIATHRPDVVVGFMHSIFVPCVLAARGLNIPVIASEHTVSEYYKSRKVEYLLMIAACLFADGVTAVSNSAAAEFPYLVRRRMDIVPNPIATHDNPSSDEADHATSRSILSVGRLDRGKNHATLIHAFSVAVEKQPDWELRIAGDGELRDKLSILIETLEVGDRVKLLGHVKDIEAEYRRASFFVLPSLYESFGMVLGEALSHGLPVIGFERCSGARDFIQDQTNGLLLSGEDQIEELTAAFDRMMEDDELRRRLSREARPSCRQFQPDAVIGKWISLFGKVRRDGPAGV